MKKGQYVQVRVLISWYPDSGWDRRIWIACYIWLMLFFLMLALAGLRPQSEEKFCGNLTGKFWLKKGKIFPCTFDEIFFTKGALSIATSLKYSTTGNIRFSWNKVWFLPLFFCIFNNLCICWWWVIDTNYKIHFRWSFAACRQVYWF